MKWSIALLFGIVVLPTIRLQAQPTLTRDWAWTTRAWKDDDKPYSTMRVNLNRAAQQKHLTDASVQKFKAAYKKNSFNAQALFRWAFSAYARENAQPTVGSRRLRGVVDAFERVETFKPVSAYNFVRLRFLIVAIDAPYHELLPAGKRLLMRAPNDYYVKLYTATILYHDDPKEGPLKRRYIADLMKQNPGAWKPRQLLADIYYRRWLFGGGRKEADAAIAIYRQLAQKKPVNTYFQQMARGQISRIERIQSQREARAQKARG